MAEINNLQSCTRTHTHMMRGSENNVAPRRWINLACTLGTADPSIMHATSEGGSFRSRLWLNLYLSSTHGKHGCDDPLNGHKT
jgi:hypothetical protein